MYFLSCLACGLLALPALNLAGAVASGTRLPRSTEHLFAVDTHVAPRLNGLLYRAGISASPQDVVIGRDGWLYLGDRYDRTLTSARRGQTQEDRERAERIGRAAQAWEAWMRKRGVRLYRVLVGPDKTSIYPEHLPQWAQPAAPAAVDGLLARAAPWYVDPRPALVQAKPAAAAPLLYYRTDTHWTDAGAAVAFRAFAAAVARDAPELRWPDERLLALRNVAPRGGGDLAAFLRMTGTLDDLEPVTGVRSAHIDTIRYDHAGRVLHAGGNPVIPSPTRPVRVVATGALNASRVLWLRDSFGSALSPLMAATFAETLQLHYEVALAAGPYNLARLVETWRPDYVFVTVVERAALSPVFSAPPPAEHPPQRLRRPER